MNKIFHNFKMFLLVGSLIYLSTSAQECENLIEGGSVNQQLLGKWQLVRMEGSLQDICLNEQVEFLSSGTAQLTCPGQSTISRSYSADQVKLTYLNSNVQYRIDELTTSKVKLTGINVNRRLEYNKIITTDNVKSSGTSNKNSSED
ncbi:MAG TPA: hypothetical protein DEP28_04695 [Bacteroidetes bacterium]|nr:hypothetical protein [Ignavibacteria bacterium]HCA42534.1 hypothetical protein [Bacteroidota bacterium]HCN36916.1 hypothetical protein [Bacteroidota bacterium]